MTAETRACAVAPWIENPYRLVSLEDIVKKVMPAVAMKLYAAFEVLSRERLHRRDEVISDERRKGLRALTVFHEIEFGDLGLKASSVTIKRIQERLINDAMTWGEMYDLASELNGRITDELGSTFFLALEPPDVDLYQAAHPFGDVVADKFPSAQYDISEAAKSLALDRGTAVVFHLCRVMEYGLRSLGASLGDPRLVPANNPTWGRILNRCRQELEREKPKRSPEWRQHDEFYAGAYAHLLAVKEAWRNPTMHIASKYTEEEARDIWDHVRRFMAHLAAKLCE